MNRRGCWTSKQPSRTTRTDAHRAALLKQLENGRNIVRRQLDRGVSPDEYRRLTRVLEACDAAATVLEAPRGNHG